jgi:polysaccharide export outer membrane protein
VEPQVTVSVSSVQSRKIVVLGEVRAPGVFALDTELTILDAVGKAGGWGNDAKTSDVLLVRKVGGKAEVFAFNMNDALQGGDSANNRQLLANDIVYVPTKKIANMARFMSYIGTILTPFVITEGGILLWPQMLDALQGKSSGTIAIPTR